MTIRVFTVPEITCGHCKTAIEDALSPLDGIRSANVDITARQVRVDYDETMISPDALVATIVDQGYDVPAQE